MIICLGFENRVPTNSKYNNSSANSQAQSPNYSGVNDKNIIGQ